MEKSPERHPQGNVRDRLHPEGLRIFSANPVITRIVKLMKRFKCCALSFHVILKYFFVIAGPLCISLISNIKIQNEPND